MLLGLILCLFYQNGEISNRAVDGPGLQRAGPGLADTLIKTGRAEHENGPGRKIQARQVIGKQVAT